MNTNTLEGNWNQLKGEAKKRWGKLTNDDLEIVEGKRDVLAGRIQERYGKKKEEIEKEIDEFCLQC